MPDNARNRQPHRRLGATAVAVAALILGLSTATPAHAAITEGHGPLPFPGRHLASPALFDDFSSYGSGTDPKLSTNGWTVRTGGGGPGISGAASWNADNVSFPRVDGVHALRLTATTDGTAIGTKQSEFYRTAEESLTGTYVARIKFSDAPASGTDGDHVVQTFFAISTTPDCDPTYSETDFTEYLPNGGYGNPDTFNSQTTWQLTGDDCSSSDETDEARSYSGWHTVLATVANGHVKYYIDGRLVADHDGLYYPRRAMQIDFNQWFVDLDGHTGPQASTWHEDVDYVYYAKDRILTPLQARIDVAKFRLAGKPFVDTLVAK